MKYKISIVLLLIVMVALVACSKDSQTIGNPNKAEESVDEKTESKELPGNESDDAEPLKTALEDTKTLLGDLIEASPEDMGMDSGYLEEMLNHIENNAPYINSILVLKDGHIVLEEYYNGTDEDTLQPVYSITKSFMSAIIGIALDKGYLQSIDQKVIDFFPQYDLSEADPRIKDITIEHLLTMTSGIKYQLNNFSEYNKWWNSEDPTEFALNLPIIENPGETYRYNDPGVHLLSAILKEETGRSTYEFAKDYLFTPLGIEDIQWPVDNQGNQNGCTGLQIRIRDVAKLGYLYLQKGKIEETSVVPSDWIKISTQAQNTGGYPSNEDYGYLWWVLREEDYNTYFAMGYGGQFLYIVPKLNLVTVVTTQIDNHRESNRDLVETYIIPSIVNINPQGTK
ncbi:serine hydrolase [Mobilitalea sibirica]|uniref:Serine hydrolase n=1 Tax=Mobilitalea sibirica TaxID=1462919 RepID=A0A8J7H950_9FIRM|nr:serine hydrolase [Mobilitalea sibirica]MBH1940790.1 serine hydrolase [Mobilitalea sibirica]